MCRAGEERVGGVGADDGGDLEPRRGVDNATLCVEQPHAWESGLRCDKGPWCLGQVPRRNEGDHPDSTAGRDAGEFLARMIGPWIRRKPSRSAGEHHRNLPCQVDALEIVVIELRGLHAVTDKHRRGFDPTFSLAGGHPDNDIG